MSESGNDLPDAKILFIDPGALASAQHFNPISEIRRGTVHEAQDIATFAIAACDVDGTGSCTNEDELELLRIYTSIALRDRETPTLRDIVDIEAAIYFSLDATPKHLAAADVSAVGLVLLRAAQRKYGDNARTYIRDIAAHFHERFTKRFELYFGIPVDDDDD